MGSENQLVELSLLDENVAREEEIRRLEVEVAKTAEEIKILQRAQAILWSWRNSQLANIAKLKLWCAQKEATRQEPAESTAAGSVGRKG